MSKMYLSIVIPAYNESKNFEKGALEKVRQYLNSVEYAYEVLVVDDGSTDGTQKLIEDFCKKNKHFKFIAQAHRGKAYTIYNGVCRAKGELVLFTDFDQATPLKEVEKLISYIEKGYEIAIGSREIKGAKREKEPFYRHLMGKGFNMVVRLVALGGIADTQCGFKLFKRDVIQKLYAKTCVYSPKSDKVLKHAFTGAVDVELLFIAKKMAYKVAEIPVAWEYYSTVRVNPIRDSLLMFFDVLKIRQCALLGKYE